MNNASQSQIRKMRFLQSVAYVLVVDHLNAQRTAFAIGARQILVSPVDRIRVAGVFESENIVDAPKMLIMGNIFLDVDVLTIPIVEPNLHIGQRARNIVDVDAVSRT